MVTPITTPAGLAEALNRLTAEMAVEPLMALDTETYSDGRQTNYAFHSDPWTNRIRLVQMKSRQGEPVLIDIKAFKLGDLTPLKNFLRRADIVWVIHNAKFDFKELVINLGVHLKQIYCTAIANSIVGFATGADARRACGMKLNHLVKDLLGIEGMDKSQQNTKWGGDLTQAQLDYAHEDVVHLIPLYDAFTAMFQDSYECPDAVALEMRTLPSVCRMELKGMELNLPLYRLVQRCAAAQVPELLKQLCRHFKIPMQVTADPLTGTMSLKPALVNFASNPEVKALFHKHGITVENLKDETLAPLRDVYPILGVYAEWSALTKQLSNDYEIWIHPVTGRIHGTYNQSGAGTGRFSASNPNMQQVSKYDVLVPEFIVDDLKANGLYWMIEPYWSKDRNGHYLNYRYCFQAPKGKKLGGLDYAGQEIAAVVALSKDPFMIEVMNKPKLLYNPDGSPLLDAKGKHAENLEADLHSQAAAVMFKIKPEEARNKPPQFNGKSYRDLAKAVVFGLCYGKSHQSLALEWGITEEAAKKIVDDFFRPMQRLKKYLDEQGVLGMATKVCRFALGRLRFLGDLRNADRKAPDRAARNTPIQGISALMMKLALCLLDDLMLANPDTFWIVGCVHDEAIIEIRDECIERMLPLIRKAMIDAEEFFLDGIVPGDVGIGIGQTWTK